MKSVRRSAALASLLAVVLACGQSSSDPSSARLKVYLDGSPQRGPSDAWVTLVEFADFQCSYCRSEEPVVNGLLSVYGEDLRLVFKHLPLTRIHSYAQAAAVAAACAGEQDRFWEMHDLLFTTALDTATIQANANQILGLDITAWQACFDSSTPPAVIANDVALATSVGVPGTPSFVVNGWLVVGALPESELRAVIDRALSDAIASGISRDQYYDRVVLGN